MIAWADEIPAALMFVSVISIHELERAVLLAERTDAAKGELLRTWLDNSVVPAFVERILPVDLDVAVRAAGLHVPDRHSQSATDSGRARSAPCGQPTASSTG